jgi:U3 small nucleolar RNA-associated protein 25
MERVMFGRGKSNVTNKARFDEEYGTTTEDMHHPKATRRPDDYYQLFAGNIDDNFKLGIRLSKRAIHLFQDFYFSDIVIASPLGLRMTIGVEGEKAYDYDFLSSIELCVLDQADVFLMQNWSHVTHIFEHLNRQPHAGHDADFARVYSWALDNRAAEHRQTLVSAEFLSPEMNALFSRYCSNRAGRIALRQRGSFGGQGTVSAITLITAASPQPPAASTSADHESRFSIAFQRYNAYSLDSDADDRFEYFVKNILPEYSGSAMSHTMIFVSSYFDFVRLRNYLRREDFSFSQVCEYAENKKVSQARDLFFHGERHLLLYTERFHFYRRYRIKGIRHVIFYQLPCYARFVPEMCNMIDPQARFKSSEAEGDVGSGAPCPSPSAVALYSKFDALRLAHVVGNRRAREMMAAESHCHVISADE